MGRELKRESGSASDKGMAGNALMSKIALVAALVFAKARNKWRPVEPHYRSKTTSPNTLDPTGRLPLGI